MVFYSSFYEAVSLLPDDEYRKCMDAILNYGLKGECLETDGVSRAVFIMAKPQIDANNERFLNGKKGGRPKKEKPQVSKNDKNGKPMVFKNDQNTKPNENVNVNENENENVSVNVNANEKEKRVSGQGPDVCVLGEYENVFLSESEQNTLIRTLGCDNFGMAVTYLSRYLKRKPTHSSKCHFEDLRGWVQQALASQAEADERRRKRQAEGEREAAPSSFDGITFEDIYER